MASYLLFELRGTRYALDAAAIKTTVWLPTLSPVENLPRHFIGLFNLHGDVVPVVDLGLRFGHAPRPLTATQAIMVLRTAHAQQALGLQADTVLDLADIPDSERGAYVRFGAASPEQDDGLISGSLRHDAGVLIELDATALPHVPLQAGPADAAAQAAADAGDAGDAGALHASHASHASHPSHAAPATDAADDYFGFFAPEKNFDRDALRRAERAAALPRPAESDAEALQHYAIVRIGAGRFAVALEQVREFGHLGHCAPLPFCPPHILGCINLRGSILAVLDAGPFVHGAPQQDYAKVVVLRLGNETIGLAVHEIEDVRAVAADALTPLSGQAYGHQHCHALLNDPDNPDQPDHLAGSASGIDFEALQREGLIDVDVTA